MRKTTAHLRKPNSLDFFPRCKGIGKTSPASNPGTASRQYPGSSDAPLLRLLRSLHLTVAILLQLIRKVSCLTLGASKNEKPRGFFMPRIKHFTFCSANAVTGSTWTAFALGDQSTAHAAPFIGPPLPQGGLRFARQHTGRCKLGDCLTRSGARRACCRVARVQRKRRRFSDHCKSDKPPPCSVPRFDHRCPAVGPMFRFQGPMMSRKG